LPGLREDVYLLLFIYLEVLGFELQVVCLLGRQNRHLCHSASPIYLLFNKISGYLLPVVSFTLPPTMNEIWLLLMGVHFLKFKLWLNT
jgi:hypothetical protein